ncbi:MAG: hypothetical protein LBH10_05850 [Burkholderiaceae bacterium]|jgi:hypothetical protein|nr:hypothetical protein [Burkholderiaceae bacterium]
MSIPSKQDVSTQLFFPQGWRTVKPCVRACPSRAGVSFQKGVKTMTVKRSFHLIPILVSAGLVFLLSGCVVPPYGYGYYPATYPVTSADGTTTYPATYYAPSYYGYGYPAYYSYSYYSYPYYWGPSVYLGYYGGWGGYSGGWRGRGGAGWRSSGGFRSGFGGGRGGIGGMGSGGRGGGGGRR